MELVKSKQGTTMDTTGSRVQGLGFRASRYGSGWGFKALGLRALGFRVV